MVFCKDCSRKVVDCEHCAFPIAGIRVPVYDEKVETLAYAAEKRVLEIAFKSGQVWQLSNVPEPVYAELRDSTISSFLKFISHRYKATPVKSGLAAIAVPKNEKCPVCSHAMNESNRTSSEFDKFIRVFWQCPSCKKSKWETYSGQQVVAPQKERKLRWH